MKFLFVVFSTIISAFIGLFLAKFLIPKGVGLAGGAMVLGYGILGLFIGLVASLLLKNKLSKSLLKTLSLIFGTVCLSCIIWLTFQINQSRKDTAADRKSSEEFYATHKPTQEAEPLVEMIEPVLLFDLGMAKPNFLKMSPLYFYHSPYSQLSAPVDSITYSKTEQGDIQIATAPSSFKPAHLKLDYQLFYFRVVAQTKQYFQVFVNEKTNEQGWIRRDQVSITSWPDFLLHAFSIEPIDPKMNPVRLKPLDQATVFRHMTKEDLLVPIRIQAEWMEVRVLNPSQEEKGRGWVKWRSDETLIISYSLLS